ncbi:MAG: FeoB small GTPase domain-containing protein [Candidatus Promineifilaceae bacterium]|nr:FeoB small GTPase domain-containing protein [Candidatus Promineifilaceae bacterium]
MKQIRVALAGNPNTGKSTLFNSLTGSQQHVGNWPGKTVARKEGFFVQDGTRVEIVDLPGAYSLSVYSPEEAIARDYIVEEKPDVVVNVLDAANLERNLYLTLQIVETGRSLVVVLNMSDVAAARGYRIDTPRLSELLGAPVIQAVASQERGLAQLRAALVRAADTLDTGVVGEEDDSSHAAVERLRQLHGCH